VTAEGEGRGKRKDCHERALGLLAVRQRSRRELERRLTQAGFDPDEIDAVLTRLEAVGLVDDEAFARSLAEHRLGGRKEARRVVAGRLAAAGVAADTSASVLDELAGDERDRAAALAQTRLGRLWGLPPEKAASRLYGFLCRRGYPPDIARSVTREALAAETIDD
jgi:regulatory protein